MSENPEASDLLVLAQNLVFSLDAPALVPFRSAWPDARASSGERDSARASQLPVLRSLGQILQNADASGLTAPLAAKLRDCASAIPWRQTYTSADVSKDFLSNYGYAEIIGSTATVHSDTLAVGFLLLGPHTMYPKHRHEAEEIYIPLSGTAAWLQGDGIWRSRLPGTILHHLRHEPHAMHTGDQPLLALYLWLSDNLTQKVHLE